MSDSNQPGMGVGEEHVLPTSDDRDLSRQIGDICERVEFVSGHGCDM